MSLRRMVRDMSKWDAETAEWYAEKYGEYATNRLAVDALDLDSHAVVVDVGCGTGAALRHASTRVTEGRLVGIDPIERMVAIARERTATHAAHARIEFRVGPAERLPVADASADVVFAFDSFDHWQDPRLGLQEIRRILRQDGQLTVVKDGGLPGGAEARSTFLGELTSAGFVVPREQTIGQDGVEFTMWVCRLATQA